MRVMSYIRMGTELAPVEVELTLSPGLPQFQFMGLPDAALKESALRIRSALREQGFQFPQSHSILVHLKPTHLKKTSRGLDLAIAAAVLWESAQLEAPRAGELPILYGEVTLKGEVVRPEDADEIILDDGRCLTTGPGLNALECPTKVVRDLRALASPDLITGAPARRDWIRPSPEVRTFSKSAAEVAAIVAAGEHAVLLAGPPGSGKSTLAGAIPSWIQSPELNADVEQARRLWRRAGVDLKWRPVLRPHHSITPKAMIGGGTQLWAGEITRAHGGVLIMDELLEFHREIQEALREPVETGSISLSRAGRSRTYPARLLLIATTNLCACGKFVPRRSSMGCRCAKSIRQKMLSRLTGPFVDRFAVFALTDQWAGEGAVRAEDIAEKIRIGIRFRIEERKQTAPNAHASPELIEEGLSEFQRSQLMGMNLGSRRRRASILRVARTSADLRCSMQIGDEDFETAIRLSLEAHRLLEVCGG
jgi:magnesium chelatase family protein